MASPCQHGSRCWISCLVSFCCTANLGAKAERDGGLFCLLVGNRKMDRLLNWDITYRLWRRKGNTHANMDMGPGMITHVLMRLDGCLALGLFFFIHLSFRFGLDLGSLFGSHSRYHWISWDMSCHATRHGFMGHAAGLGQAR